MKKVFTLSGHTSARIYLYDSQFTKRQALYDPDSVEITNLNTMGLLDFELGELKKKRILGGKLTAKVLTEDCPAELAVTTVSDHWDPAFANNFIARENAPWGGDKWLCDVIMSNGGSVYHRVKTLFDPQTRLLTVEIPGDILQACAWGISGGFGLIDTKSRSYAPLNGAIWCGDAVHKKLGTSAACGFIPALEVEFEDLSPVTVAAVSRLGAMAVEQPESFTEAEVLLNWKPEAEGRYYYDIRMAETDANVLPLSQMKPVARRMIPVYRRERSVEGTKIEGLKPDTDYLFAVTVSDGVCVSEPEYVRVRTLPARMPIAYTAVPVCAEQEGILKTRTFAVAVTTELDKTDPVTGRSWFSRSPLRQEARAAVCPTEKIAFRLLVENLTGGPARYTACVTDNRIASCHSGSAVTLSRSWYLKIAEAWYPDAQIPVEGEFRIPWVENGIEGQRFQELTVDLELPADTKPGVSTFRVTISDGSSTLDVPFILDVAPVKLQKADFKAELNGYVNLSQCAGYTREDPEFEEAEQEYYRLAREHGMVCNILPYFHTGIVQEGFAPTVEMKDGVPTVTDWTPWDRHFEKYLSGTYVGAGKREPVSHIYLPFHEYWPMPMKDYYRVDMSDFSADDYPENINQHKLRAHSLWEDFAPGYREGIKAVMKEFIRHIDEKGWNEVTFQYFLNNKHFYKRKGFLDACKDRRSLEFWLTKPTCGNDGAGTSWWLLDEPNFMDDWDAIAYYGSILREARAETGSGENIRFRADLSCYNLMFDHLDGILDIGVCGSTFYNNREDYLRDRRVRHGEDYWVYGSWNAIDENNLDSTLWFLDSYLRGGQGIVPWYNYALDYNYEAADTCAAVYPGKRFGSVKPFPSLRLKAGRKAMEMIRYFATMKHTFGYSDLQLRTYAESFLQAYGLSLSGQTVKENDIDAGTVHYQNAADSTALEALKADMLCRLAAACQYGYLFEQR